MSGISIFSIGSRLEGRWKAAGPRRYSSCRSSPLGGLVGTGLRATAAGATLVLCCEEFWASGRMFNIGSVRDRTTRCGWLPGITVTEFPRTKPGCPGIVPDVGVAVLLVVVVLVVVALVVVVPVGVVLGLFMSDLGWGVVAVLARALLALDLLRNIPHMRDLDFAAVSSCDSGCGSGCDSGSGSGCGSGTLVGVGLGAKTLVS